MLVRSVVVTFSTKYTVEARASIGASATRILPRPLAGPLWTVGALGEVNRLIAKYKSDIAIYPRFMYNI